MNIIKKIILCSLCLSHNSNFLSAAQENNAVDFSEDFIILCGSDEEIYPIEDADTISSIEDIQNYIDDLEFDPIALSTNSVDLPCAPADIVILGQGEAVACDITELNEIIAENQIEVVVDIIEADEPEMPIILSVDFTDTSFEAQDIDEYHESDYLLPEVIEEIIIEVEVLTPADQEVFSSNDKLDDDQALIEAESVLIAEVTPVQTEVVNTVKDLKKKDKKGFFNRSKKNKNKK